MRPPPQERARRARGQTLPLRRDQGPGNAGVWIALGGGNERHILFEGGAPVATDGAAALSYDKRGDLYLIHVGDERYEIPEAVVYGG